MTLEITVRQDKVVIWEINSASTQNSLGITLANELTNALIHIKTSTPRALCIRTSATSQTWIAGGNLKELMDLKSKEEGAHYASLMRNICLDLERLPCPVIMEIHGPVIGGGIEFALAGDIRYGTNDSSLHFKQLTLGLATGYGGAKRLVDLLGYSQANYLLLTCSEVTAEKALNIGFYHQLFPDTQKLRAGIDKTLDEIKKLDPKALSVQKQMLIQARESTSPTAEIKETALFTNLWMEAPHQEALRQFLERKKPPRN